MLDDVRKQREVTKQDATGCTQPVSQEQ